MKCLLDLLRGHSVDLIYDELEFDQLLALAEEEHILPWVAHLCAQQGSLPSELRRRLDLITRDAAVAAFYWSSQLKSILSAFEQRHIVAVPLKGPFLAERLFGDAALRASYDLDLLISKEDWTKSQALLSELGFVADTPDDYHQQWLRGGTVIEVHYDVENPLAFNFHIAHVLQRIQPAVFQGSRCWQLSPDDEMLFLCLHGVRHIFGRMSHVLDLCFAFEKLAISPVRTLGPEMAERSSLLMLGLAMTRRLQPDINPTPFPDIPSGQRGRLESVADRLWDRLLTRSGTSLDWRTLHSFFLEIELPERRLGRNIRHLQILLTRAIKADYEFAAQFGFRRGWQIRLLRPLRLIRDVLRPRTNL